MENSNFNTISLLSVQVFISSAHVFFISSFSRMAEKIVGECQVFLNLKSSTFRADYFYIIISFRRKSRHSFVLSNQ